MKKVVIIGNGFDLSHNLKTKYCDFINNNEFDSSIVKWKKYCNKYIIKNWSDFEATLWELYEKNTNKLNDKEINEMVNTFKKIRKMLIEYLKSIDYTNLEIKNYFVEEFKTKDAFINFNYTNLLSTYYKINTEKIINIHGYLKNENTIVFGCSDFGCSNTYIGEIMTMSKRAQVCLKEFIDYASKRNIYEYDNFSNNHVQSLIGGRGDLCREKICLDIEKDFFNDIFSNNSKLFYKSLNVDCEELTVIGHSISKSDYYSFSQFSAQMKSLKKINVYARNKKEFESLKGKLSNYFDLNKINICMIVFR